MKNIEENILQLVKEANPDNPMSFVHNIVKDYSKEKMDDYINECKDCEISNCNIKTNSFGNANAPILIIGESAPINPYIKNPLFEYEHGDELYKALAELNINTDKLFFINSVNCYPYRNRNNEMIKRAPTKKERTNCKVFLDYAIKNVEPLLIICLGGVAINGINEEIGKQNISKARGNYFLYHGIDVLPTYHPGYFHELIKDNRFDENYINILRWDFFNDLKMAFENFDKQYGQYINIYKE